MTAPTTPPRSQPGHPSFHRNCSQSHAFPVPRRLSPILTAVTRHWRSLVVSSTERGLSRGVPRRMGGSPTASQGGCARPCGVPCAAPCLVSQLDAGLKAKALCTDAAPMETCFPQGVSRPPDPRTPTVPQRAWRALAHAELWALGLDASCAVLQVQFGFFPAFAATHEPAARANSGVAVAATRTHRRWARRFPALGCSLVPCGSPHGVGQCT